MKLDGCYSLPTDMDVVSLLQFFLIPIKFDSLVYGHLILWTIYFHSKFILILLFSFKGYPEFGRHLNGTGRAMIYSCSWPVYQIYAGISVNNMNHCLISNFLT